MKTKIRVPFMNLMREDLEDSRIPYRMSNKKFKIIAEHLGNILAEGWDSHLQYIHKEYPELFKK